MFKCYPFFVSQVAFPRIVKKNFNCKEQGNHVSMEDVPVFWEGARERRRIIRYPTSAHSSRHIATACSTTYTSLYLETRYHLQHERPRKSHFWWYPTNSLAFFSFIIFHSFTCHKRRRIFKYCWSRLQDLLLSGVQENSHTCVATKAKQHLGYGWRWRGSDLTNAKSLESGQIGQSGQPSMFTIC